MVAKSGNQLLEWTWRRWEVDNTGCDRAGYWWKAERFVHRCRFSPLQTRFVTGAQAIQSTRWPFDRDTFYGMVRNKLIPRYVPYEGARPVFKVEDIDQVFSIESGD